jgi:uncharacterized protein (DUF2141 family)
VIKKAPCLIILKCLLLLTASDLFSQTVEVTVTGIRSEKGQIAIGVFLDEESFRREKAYLEIQFPKKDIRDGVMTVSFSLEPGIYGLSLLDDENSNRKMEYNFLGIPKEGFGFSDYYHTGITRPKFDHFRFTVVQGQDIKIKVRMRYF